MLLTDDCAINLTYDPDCLYVRVEGSSYCLAPWYADMACSRYENRHWRPVPDPPDWRFGEYRPRTKLYSPVTRFLALIPPELRRLAGRFAWMQVPALRLLRLTPYAAQLAANEPFLFWLMAVAFQQQRFSAGECLVLFRLPRRKILAALMGEDPGGKYLSVNTLHKLRPQLYDSDEYIMFMALYQTGLFKTARYAPSICLQTLEEVGAISVLLGKVPYYLWPEARHLFQECCSLALSHEAVRLTVENIHEHMRITENRDDPACIHLIISDIEMPEKENPAGDYRTLDEKTRYFKGKAVENIGNIFESVRHRVIACRDLHDLRRLHDELMEPFLDSFQEPEGLPPFPPPPLAGSDTIVPITTPLELYEEGIVMKHCVYSLSESVSSGRIYIYRVLAPERGTLSVSIFNGRRRIDEFSLYRNAKPSAASLAHVRAWLISAVGTETTLLVSRKINCVFD